MRPSFLSTGISGTIAFIASILFIMNYKTLSTSDNIQLLFLMSIAYGIHSITHHYEELYYDFNPLVGKWAVRDNKI